MSDTKHTPGPWRQVKYEHPGDEPSIVGADDEPVCDFGVNAPHYSIGGIPPSDADMALMLAAPDLLAALEEGRRAIGDHNAPSDCYATGPLTGNSFLDLVQCPACSFTAMYDAAIAKAKGGVSTDAEQKPHPEYERGVKAAARFVRTWSATPRPGGRRDRLASDMVRELLAPKGGES